MYDQAANTGLLAPESTAQPVSAEARGRPLDTAGRRLLGIGTLWVLLALFFPFVLPAASPVSGGDIWTTVKSGELIVERRALLRDDPFTFAPHTSTYMNPQWLAQLAYYLPYRALGLEGLALFNALVVTATFGLLLHLSWRRSDNLRVAATSTILAAMVVATNLRPRPQTLAFLLFMLTYWLLVCGQRSRWSLAALAGVTALWTNIHGSFLLGPALAVLLLAGAAIEAISAGGWRALVAASPVRFLTQAVAVQALATLANPYGIGIYEYVFRLSADPIVRNFITEWWPTTVQDVTGIIFFLSVGVMVGVMVLSRRPGPADSLVLVAFAALGVQALRNVAWWGLAIGPILAVHLAHLPPLARLAQAHPASRSRSSERPLLNLVLAGFILLAMASALPWLKHHSPLLPADKHGMIEAGTPAAAADFLLANPIEARILNYQLWGGYLGYRLWPQYQLFLDGRIELHPPEVWMDYLSINFGRVSWQERLDHYGIDLLLLSKDDQPELVALASTSDRWSQIYEDDLAIIFRKAPEMQPADAG